MPLQVENTGAVSPKVTSIMETVVRALNPTLAEVMPPSVYIAAL